MKVLLAGDSEVVTARIEARLRGALGLSVQVGSARALGRLIEQHEPAVVVLAVTASRVASTLATLAGFARLPPVVLVADDPHAAWTPSARPAGVRAVLGHDATAEELVAALTATAAGLIALDPAVFAAPARAASRPSVEDTTLTARELDVLQMLTEGLSNQAIARRLAISAYTVKFHVASILDKLGAGSRTEAVTLGVRRGLITL